MDKLKGKVIQLVLTTVGGYNANGYIDITIVFTDGSKLYVQPSDCNYIETKLIEPTLSSDVIPIGANTLGEGSV